MLLASLRSHGVAIITNDCFVPIGDFFTRRGLLFNGASMIDLIAGYERFKPALSEATAGTTPIKLDAAELKHPVEMPSKIWAAAANYKRGSTDINKSRGRGAVGDYTAQEILEMTFLKPPSAVVGPEQAVLIPRNAQGIFPEVELCVVIGKKCRGLSKDEALEAVFGYTIILDMTVRSYGSGKTLQASRCVRKGFDTFAPIGPWIVTKDEIEDPQNLGMRLWVNGELRQSARTDGMVNGVAELVAYLSMVGTLYPGDLIATGNPDSPDFQQELKAGDILRAEIEGIGAMNLNVEKESSFQ